MDDQDSFFEEHAKYKKIPKIKVYMPNIKVYMPKIIVSQIHSTVNTIENRVSTVKIIDCLTSLTFIDVVVNVTRNLKLWYFFTFK